MTSWRQLLAAGLFAASLTAAWPAAALPPLMSTCTKTIQNDPERVFVSTPLGDMTIQLFPSVAPNTVANFLGYIERGDYADTIVHRIVPNGPGTGDDFVVQMGGFAQSGTRFFAIETQDPLANEPCISNVQGTVAMAKLSGMPNSATSQWFVNLNDNLSLDLNQNGRFTAFGEVIDGLPVATDIVNLVDKPPTTPLPPYLTDIQGPEWPILFDSPLLGPLVDAGVHGCFDVSQSGMLLVENPQDAMDFEPGTLQDLPFAITSTACAGAGSGGSPSFACNPPGRRVVRVDPDTGELVPDASAPFGFAEVLLSCEDIAASEAGFSARLADLNGQLDSLLVKTSYTVPEPGLAGSAAASLLTLSALFRRSRRSRR